MVHITGDNNPRKAVFHKLKLPLAGFSLVGGLGGCPPYQNFDKSPFTKILSLLINVPLHLVWHSLLSISESPPL